MFGHATYLTWLAVFVALPIVVLVLLRPAAVRRRWRALAWTLAGAFVGGWAWDFLAVRLGAWYFDDAHIAGVWLGGLPIEEWLWILGVSLMFGLTTVLLKERPS